MKIVSGSLKGTPSFSNTSTAPQPLRDAFITLLAIGIVIETIVALAPTKGNAQPAMDRSKATNARGSR